MELYEEHYRELKEYKKLDIQYNNLLSKKAQAYYSTQPKAIDFDKELIKGGKQKNVFEEFMIKVEKIDMELQKSRCERDMKAYFLKKKELELKNSAKLLNRVYYYRHIENMKVKHIAMRIGYSKEQTYRFLKEINEKLKNDTK